MSNPTATTPKFTFEDIAPEVAPNEYTEAVAALAAEHESRIAAGNTVVAGLTITADKGLKRDGVTPGHGAKAILAFQKAANDAGYTARTHKTVETEDGQLAITFKLGKLNGRAGKPRTTEGTDENFDGDALSTPAE